MKNLVTKALGIAGITALSFLPMKSLGQNSLPTMAETDVEYIRKVYKPIYKDFSKFVKFNSTIQVDSYSYLNIKLLNKQIKRSIKQLQKGEQLRFEKDYLENMVKLMCKANYKNYKESLDLKFLDKRISEKSLKEFGLEEMYAKTLISMLKTVADNVEYEKAK